MRLPLLSLLAFTVACGGSATSASTAVAPEAARPEVHWDSAGLLTQSIPCDTPVVIHQSTDRLGIRAEYAFLRKHYPRSQRNAQSLGSANGHPVDILEIQMPDGTPYSVCFDISKFFGHL